MTSTAPHDAVMVADALFESVPRQQVCDEFWQTAALRPLAALLTSTAVDLRHDPRRWPRYGRHPITASGHRDHAAQKTSRTLLSPRLFHRCDN